MLYQHHQQTPRRTKSSSKERTLESNCTEGERVERDCTEGERDSKERESARGGDCCLFCFLRAQRPQPSLSAPTREAQHRATAIQVSEKEGTVFVTRRQGGHKERLVFSPTLLRRQREKKTALFLRSPQVFSTDAPVRATRCCPIHKTRKVERERGIMVVLGFLKWWC